MKILYKLPIFIMLTLGLVFLLSPEHGKAEDASARGSLTPPAPRTTDEQQVIDAYKRTNRAVVNVSTRAQTMDVFGSTAQQGSGSGVIIDPEKGYVITNWHVIEGAQEVALTLSNGQSYRVRLIGQDPDNDLALLQIIDPPAELISVSYGDSASLEVGQRVLAIGNPFGLNRTLTMGIISSLERSIRAESGRVIQDVIQTDAAINPGNSGGPLLDAAGRLIGLNTAILSRSGESAGIGFAVPVNTLKSAIPQLVRYGRVLRPKVGIILADTEYGPVLLDVQEGSPASQVGLKGARQFVKQARYEGYVLDFSDADFIVGVNGHEVRTKADILDALSNIEPNSSVELVVRRGLGRASVRTVKVTPVLG